MSWCGSCVVFCDVLPLNSGAAFSFWIVMIYRPEIDGLRALAVMPVIFFHAGFEFAAGGYIGVDVFFVLSGFLITSILLGDLEAGRFSIFQFYERRARRILPALCFVVLCCIPVAWLLLTPTQMKDFGHSVGAVGVFASNVLFWRKSDYFSPDSEESPLLHTWSLAVEEQFYIIFPVLLWILWRFGTQRIFIILLTLALLSLGMSEWGWRNVPTDNFYLTHFRSWELLSGSIAAFIVRVRGVRSNDLIASVGLMAIFASFIMFDEATPFPSLFTLLPVGGVVILLLYGSSQTLIGALLSNKVLVGVGLISYSAYLWHQPLFAFSRIANPALSTSNLISLIIMCVLLATISWRYVEQPFRGNQPLLETRKFLFGSSIAALSAFVAFGVFAHVTRGFDNRFQLRSGIPAQEFTMALRNNGYCFYSFHVSQTVVGPEGLECWLGANRDEATATILVSGDSFSGHWDPFWDTFGKENNFTVHSIATNWCFPALTDVTISPQIDGSIEQCVINREYVKSNLAKYDMVVFSGAWWGVEDKGKSLHTHEFIQHVAENYDVPVVIMDTPVQLKRASVERAVYDENAKLIVDSERDQYSQTFWANLHATFSESKNIYLLDRTMLFGNDATVTSANLPYSLEGKHISIFGANQAYEYIKTQPIYEVMVSDVRN